MSNKVYIKGDKYEWEYTIGLEVHAQVSTKSKIFSSAATEFGADPNTQVTYQDAAFPGMLPVLNKECITQAIKTGLGLNFTINLFSVFDRKNYFYPDLPSGYQISQFYKPICENGWLEIIDEYNEIKRIDIQRIHLEQDAGKSVHDYMEGFSCIDLNRASVPLMEIVTMPCIQSPFQAGEYVKKLRQCLVYLETCNGNMDEGSLRCDANVSVRKKGSKEFGTRCEIKNLNSIKSITKAIESEARRQVDILEEGGTIQCYTMSFDDKQLKTIPLRTKETSSDYRYFPDPDLPPVVVSMNEVNKIKNELPELPDQKIKRYTTKFDISLQDAKSLTNDKEVSLYFDKIAKIANPKISANWILSTIFQVIKENEDLSISNLPVTPIKMGEIINLIQDGSISAKSAKKIFTAILENNTKSAFEIAKQNNLLQISDPQEILKLVQEICQNNTEVVERYKNGEKKLLNVLMAEVIKKTSGRANPEIVKQHIIQLLNS